ncbi:aspartate kinase [Planomicrobium sp. YIM 101495]|uniref:aspartate kinase n=1 Tax=Planomicrobium sp. YIM 101495 TaxID=2665160 RepID=UPI0012B84E0B|nr:aspartate kinase [Planomicrobium sp. YIM 101495]MTD30522.1 aspartate kinase [Planomicrobium sp. YIM 101495]
MKVSKFGGTSVSNAQQIRKVAKIIQSDARRKIIVVSAPGKRFKEDFKVTDLLIDLASRSLQSESVEETFGLVIGRFSEIAAELGLRDAVMDEIKQDFIRRLQEDKTSPAFYTDQMKAGGEDNSARLIAAYLNQTGTSAVYGDPKGGLIVCESPARVQALPEAYEALGKLADASAVHVFPGFFGYTKSGVLRTFERGGSDITGSILAAAVKAELYENFTDVDSVFAANPTVIDQPIAIEEMTYREMRELSYAGFAVLHDEALMPAFRASVPVCIRNTNNPEAPGTMIIKERTKRSERPVVGISADSGFSTLYVSKYLMNRELGFGRKLLQMLEEEDVSYEHIPSGIDNLSVIIRSHQLTGGKERRIIERIQNELHVDDVHIRSDFSMVVLVGEGMNHMIGLASRATAAISRTGANIEMINQGSSEVSLSFGVKKQDETKILQELYKEFFQPSLASTC